jgi:hypothetical protein
MDFDLISALSFSATMISAARLKIWGAMIRNSSPPQREHKS